jgi:hypothetical protein
MITEKWNEICFLLSQNVKSDISEYEFEQKVIQALSVLGWKEYLGDFEIRPSFKIGAANSITPDFIIKSESKVRLFAIEIKQPQLPINTGFQKQLFSYMRQLKLEYGLLIGQSIQIFYDGILSNQDDPILLENIIFERNSEKGEKFVELFCKGNYSAESLKVFTLKSLEKINRKEDFKLLSNKILSENFKDNIFNLIKQEFISDYDGELIDAVLNDLKIEISSKNKIAETKTNYIKQFSQPKENLYSSTTLPIELNPNNEREFKRKLLINRRAYITSIYADGKKERKIWNIRKFDETSDVIGNLRSRPEFRINEWPKRGIIKVFVSIEE